MSDTGSQATIDAAVIEELERSVGDDREFLRDLVETYLDDAPRQLDAMRTGLAGGDLERVHRAAHTLKSSSASLGAHTLAEMSRELEALARAAGSADGGAADGGAGDGSLVDRVDEMAAELERVQRQLDVLVPQVSE